MINLPLAALAASLLGLTAVQASAAQLSRQDQAFAGEAATSGMAEVEAGQMAVTRGTSPQIKQLGQMMVTDHTQANDQLSQIAQQAGVALPTQPTAAQHREAQSLSGLSGSQFDAAFARQEVQDHRKAIAQFQTEAKSGHDPALKTFAQQTIPVLQKHLRMAESASRG